MKHSDFCTHINNREDIPYLRTRLFDVNMRLFHSSEPYRKIVLSCMNYLVWWCQTEKEGYKKPHGVSGANAGIPWNIIAVNRGSGTTPMINPVITRYYGDEIKSMSNCGSLTLKEPIEIVRWEFIDLIYFDLNGKEVTEDKVDRKNGGLTIQHEVDHNHGILIYDKLTD